MAEIATSLWRRSQPWVDESKERIVPSKGHSVAVLHALAGLHGMLEGGCPVTWCRSVRSVVIGVLREVTLASGR